MGSLMSVSWRGKGGAGLLRRLRPHRGRTMAGLWPDYGRTMAGLWPDRGRAIASAPDYPGQSRTMSSASRTEDGAMGSLVSVSWRGKVGAGLLRCLCPDRGRTMAGPWPRHRWHAGLSRTVPDYLCEHPRRRMGRWVLYC